MITLPDHVSEAAYHALVETIAGAIQSDVLITDAMDNASLQPTSRAAILAAQAAVAVILAHEIGLCAGL